MTEQFQFHHLGKLLSCLEITSGGHNIAAQTTREPPPYHASLLEPGIPNWVFREDVKDDDLSAYITCFQLCGHGTSVLLAELCSSVNADFHPLFLFTGIVFT
jgi:hypothetical protein